MPLLLGLAASAGPGRAVGEASSERPLTALPYTPGLDPEAMDRGVDPCLDFYEFACGGWMRRNPIPPDQSSWDVYRKLAEENRQFLWGLLERASRLPPGEGTAGERKSGDYFAACMDEPAVERQGDAPVRILLSQVAALRSKKGIAPLLGRLDPALPDGLVFGLSSAQDAKDATSVIGQLTAGGLGLPDRDYYLQDEPRFREGRERYQAYLGSLLELVGEPPEKAREHAAFALLIETALARAELSRVDRRDPYRLYHRLRRSQLAALTPRFDWEAYFRSARAERVSPIDVTEPAFFLEVETQLEEEPLAVWQAYLESRLLDLFGPFLSRPFQRAHFEFHEAFLEGVQEEPPRWKRCLAFADRDLGEALGEMFVKKVFPPEVKKEVSDLVLRIESAMAERIRESDWMSESTKKEALVKLGLLRNKIGYPARFRDYRRLVVRRQDFFGNVWRAARFETARQLAKVGRPVDRDEWEMTPPTVNAYYDDQLNDINFPAGILLPPLWDPSMDLAPGYGNTGATIGHELTHAFDDAGRKYDGRGNLRDWWTPKDASEFKKRTACVIEQFGDYLAVDDVKVNSQLTVGEDVADLGGTTLAYLAWKEATRGQILEPRDGLTPEQRFFVGSAQWSCENETLAERRLRAVTDVHSPARFRVNGVFADMPEFRAAFACKEGGPMARREACRVW
ncbi:MAG TPA: M13 family metallopeptidase [Anaeromyxobacteraceae bacterium]|nr:M13 family metallopeptidase [Anaeromyxobacteraceae bacterium]